ncbi:MAG: Transcriptional regulatory protein UhpA [Luteibacter sp.]|nr:MAG: Transcriptional regulatory protein UhpA [Luteibacter sp.]
MFNQLCGLPMSTRPHIGPVRVALLDDHALVRKGLEAELAGDKGMVVVGSYGSSKSFKENLERFPFDVAVIDYSLGSGEADGVQLVRQLLSKDASMKILIVSAYDDGVVVGNLIRAGAKGFVAKSRPLAEVSTGIREVFKGAIYTAYTEIVEVQLPAVDLLSPNEYEVVRYFSEGMSVSQIASQLNKSMKTISTQKSNACKKLGVNSDVELLKVILPHFKSIGSSS